MLFLQVFHRSYLMSFQFREKNNKSLFEAEKIKISPKTLENLMEKSFWAGFRYCEDLKENNKSSDADYDSLNIFKDIFRGKK